VNPVGEAEPPRGLVDGIARAWRAPRRAMAAEVAAGLSERRALLHLLLACGLLFVASLPMAVRSSAGLAVDEPVSAAVSAHLFAWGALAPLLGYALAAAVQLVARAFGGRGGFLGARAALFWSALAAAPAALAVSVIGALGTVLAGRVLPQLAWLAFPAFGLWVWIFAASLAETQGFDSTGRVAGAVVLVLLAIVALAEYASRHGVR